MPRQVHRLVFEDFRRAVKKEIGIDIPESVTDYPEYEIWIDQYFERKRRQDRRREFNRYMKQFHGARVYNG